MVGYVLDSYCIERGTLLDGYKTESLLEPFRHSIHCLVDVDRCVHSGYEILQDPLDTNGDTDDRYCRAFQLDSRGNQLMLELARSNGEQGYCTTCTGPPGAPSRGFRATVYGRILQDSNVSPPMLAVTRVESMRDGCQGMAPYIPKSVNCNSGSFLPFVAAHGSLMLISWGFLLPFGVISARLLKHLPNKTLWFQIHRVVQPLGIVLALIGWITALAGPFNVLGSGVHDAQFAHATIGTIVMGLGLLQPINAYLRPHKVDTRSDTGEGMPDEASMQRRRRWELGHKGIGYLAVVMGGVNCFIGMALSGKYQDKIFNTLVAGWAFLAFYAAVLLLRRFFGGSSRGEPQQSAADTNGEISPQSD